MFEFCHIRRWTGGDTQLWTIDRGNAARWRQPWNELRFAEPNRQHGAGRELLDELSTCDDKTQRIGFRHHSSKRGSNVFTNAVTNECLRCDAHETPPLGECEFNDEQGWLSYLGLAEAFVCGVKIIRWKQHRAEIESHLRCRECAQQIDFTAKNGFAVIETRRHSCMLSTLSRKQKCDRRVFVFASGCGKIFPIGQQVNGVITSAAHGEASMGESATTALQRPCDIGKRQVVVCEMLS